MSKSTLSLLSKVFAITLMVVLILVVIAEIGLRVFIANEIKSGFVEDARAQGVQSPAEPEVSFGKSPIVAGLLARKLNQVEIDTPSTLNLNGSEATGNPATHLHMRGMALGDGMTADSVTTTADLPTEYLLASIQKAIAENPPADLGPLTEFLTVTNLETLPDQDAVSVELVHGAATLTLVPEMVNDQLSVSASKVSVFGFELPANATAALSEGLQQGIEQQAGEATGGQLRVSDVEITESGIRITLTGNNVPLRELS